MLGSHKFRPKNRISCNLTNEVLLLRKARVSSSPKRTLAMSDIEITVEPELYSMMVLVFGVTVFCNICNAKEIGNLVPVRLSFRRIFEAYLGVL